jgi:TPR repeat protein
MDSGEAKFKEGFAPPSSFEEITLIRAAAEGNNADAQYNLAVRLEHRADASGPNPDLTEAISWYRKAAANGNNKAKDALERLNVGQTE